MLALLIVLFKKIVTDKSAMDGEGSKKIVTEAHTTKINKCTNIVSNHCFVETTCIYQCPPNHQDFLAKNLKTRTHSIAEDLKIIAQIQEYYNIHHKNITNTFLAV